MPVPKYTVAAIDDHPIILDGIRRGFKNFPLNMNFLAFTQFDELLIHMQNISIDLLVIDITMPKQNGLSVIDEVKKINSKIKFAIFTQHDGEGYFKEAFRLGIHGYILKTESFLFLPEIFLRILKGEFYVSPPIACFLRSTRKKDSLDNFEHEILKMLVKGCSIREISKSLNRSDKVIEYRLRKIKDYFDAKNNVELVYKIRNQYFK